MSNGLLEGALRVSQNAGGSPQYDQREDMNQQQDKERNCQAE